MPLLGSCVSRLAALTLAAAVPLCSEPADDPVDGMARALRAASGNERLVQLRELGPMMKALATPGCRGQPARGCSHGGVDRCRPGDEEASGHDAPGGGAAGAQGHARAAWDAERPGPRPARNRYLAIKAAARLGVAAAPLMEALVDLAPGTDRYLVQAARDAVTELDPSRLAEFDARATTARRERASVAVNELGNFATACPAHQRLVALGAASVPLLIELLRETTDPSLPRAAIIRPQVGPNGGMTAVAGPGDLADLPRWHAVHVLGEIGPPADHAVPALCAALANGGEGAMVHLGAAEALGKIHARPDESVRALTAALGDTTQVPGGLPLAGVFTGELELTAPSRVPRCVHARSSGRDPGCVRWRRRSQKKRSEGEGKHDVPRPSLWWTSLRRARSVYSSRCLATRTPASRYSAKWLGP